MRTRKLLCIITALLMLAALPVPVFADSDDAVSTGLTAGLTEVRSGEELGEDFATALANATEEPAEEIEEDDPATDEVILDDDSEYEDEQQPLDTDMEEDTGLTVKAKADGRSRINVSWTRVKGCKGYDVYRSTNGKQIGKKVWSTSKMAKNRFTDEGAKIKATYYYTVKPRKDAELLRVATVDIGTSNAVKNTLDVKSSFAVKAYAYTGGGTTASGKKAQVGRIAVDPRVVKLGTWVYVEGYGLAQACDTGGNIKGKTVDLYMNSERECMKWGVRYPKMYVLN